VATVGCQEAIKDWREPTFDICSLLSIPSDRFFVSASPAIMAVNASFVSPTADAKVAHMLTQFDTAGLVSTVFNGFTFWKAALTLLVAAVIYDQCKCWRKKKVHGIVLIGVCSHVHLAKGLDCWACDEDAVYGTVPRLGQPQLHKIPREMVVWRAELRFRLPQVRLPQDLLRHRAVVACLLYAHADRRLLGS
jgi:hypothetical protein